MRLPRDEFLSRLDGVARVDGEGFSPRAFRHDLLGREF